VCCLKDLRARDTGPARLTPPTRPHIKGPNDPEDVAAQLARERALRQADKMETIGG